MKKLAQRFRIASPITALAVLFFSSWLFDHSVTGVWIAAGIMIGYLIAVVISETK